MTSTRSSPGQERSRWPCGPGSGRAGRCSRSSATGPHGSSTWWRVGPSTAPRRRPAWPAAARSRWTACSPPAWASRWPSGVAARPWSRASTVGHAGRPHGRRPTWTRTTTSGWPPSCTRPSPSASGLARPVWSTSTAPSRWRSSASPTWPTTTPTPSPGCSATWPRRCGRSGAGTVTCARSTWATRAACWCWRSARPYATRTTRSGRCAAASSCCSCPAGPSGWVSPPAASGAARSGLVLAASTPSSATPSTSPPA